MGDIRQRGRQADPKKVLFVLQHKGIQSVYKFANRVEAKMWTILPGGKKEKLPRRGAVFAFCRGKETDEKTRRTLSNELGVPFSLLEKGNGQSLSKSDLGNIDFRGHWSLHHEASYSGQVWVRVVVNSEHRRTAHKYTIRWGPWVYEGVLKFGRFESAALVHNKGHDGCSFPIIFDVWPPCCVDCGQGHPPSELVHDINHGWTRVDEA